MMSAGTDAMKRFEQIKEQFKNSNRYCLTVGYTEIEDLIQMIELLNKRNRIEMKEDTHLNVTERYNNMIEAFECDFILAQDNHIDFSLYDLQDQINDDSNEDLNNNIELLKELSYNIRHGKTIICEKKVKEMFEVTYSIEGIIRKIMINASDAVQAQSIFTNMYGSGKVQIINIRRL